MFLDNCVSGPDSDLDGWPNAQDNCDNTSNPDQRDSDNDGVGDACDNCICTMNPSQQNNDGDALGNHCDPAPNNPLVPPVAPTDQDGDGISNTHDNCPCHHNASQADSDGDDYGDTCDACSFHLVELPIYGLGRVGVAMPDIDITTDLAPDTVYTRYLNQKYYELTDHLGNVRAVLGDRKRTATPGAGNYYADIRSYSHIYPFGMPQPGRYWAASADTIYRYGFNGMETDPEVKEGWGQHYTTYFRQYDPRLGRWWSNDPITHPWESPYAGMYSNPILFSDPFGDCPGCPDPNTLPEETKETVDGQEYIVIADPEGGHVWSGHDVVEKAVKPLSPAEIAELRLKRSENPNLPPIPSLDRANLEYYLQKEYTDPVARNMVRSTLSSWQVEQILFEIQYGGWQPSATYVGLEQKTLGRQDVERDAYSWPGQVKRGEGYIPILSDYADGVVSTYTMATTGLDADGFPATEKEVAEARNNLISPSNAKIGRQSIAQRLSKGRKAGIQVPGGGLAAHEARGGGHGLTKHVAMTEEALIGRLADEPKRKLVSSFHTMGHAESSIARVLRENDDAIQHWLRNTNLPTPEGQITSTFVRSVGIKVPRATLRAEEARTVEVILYRDPGMSTGYRIHTFFLE